jgi:hypothetical protein
MYDEIQKPTGSILENLEPELDALALGYRIQETAQKLLLNEEVRAALEDSTRDLEQSISDCMQEFESPLVVSVSEKANATIAFVGGKVQRSPKSFIATSISSINEYAICFKNDQTGALLSIFHTGAEVAFDAEPNDEPQFSLAPLPQTPKI